MSMNVLKTMECMLYISDFSMNYILELYGELAVRGRTGSKKKR